jgi:peptide/nickel transport system ATP-binding protein
VTLLEIEDLVVRYPVRGARRRVLTAVDHVSFDVRPHETVGLVGESGAGKSSIGRAVLGLAPVESGRIVFGGSPIQGLSRRQRRALAGRIQVVFQDPFSSLNPAMCIDDLLAEPLRALGRPAYERHARVSELLDQVGLPEHCGRRHVRELSGGQRQRVAIARALAIEPELIVCDEPVSAVDAPTRERIVRLLIEIQESTGVAYLFISHDLAVVRQISHRVAVLRQGRVVELGSCAQVTADPRHEFTEELLLASPVADPVRQRERRGLRLERSAAATDRATRQP